CAGRNAGARQSQGVTEDSTMTEDETGLNRRKALDIRTGWLVESPYGADLRKGNHVVCRLPTLTTTKG
ncbi:MAG: hypothetical protein WB390_00750, partial [Pseudolabrys sp.]